jgi:hypothetical protein
MAGVGFYRMQRGWQEGALFTGEPFSKRDAWVWLIEEAAYVPREIMVSGRAITLQRGQLCHSLRFMARAWKWDEAKVRRFISRGKILKQIDASTDAGQTLITIRNYDKYQSPQHANDAASDAETTQQRRGDDANENEGKEIKKEEESAAGAASLYAFEGRVIRLKRSDLDKWLCSWPDIDVVAALQSRDDWLATEADESTRRKWFLTTSNHLANLQQRAKSARDPVLDEFRI